MLRRRCYFQVPNKQGVRKIPKFNKRGGVKTNGGSEFYKRLWMIIQERKEQNQAVIKHKTNIYTAARYFAMKIGRK